MRSSKLATIMSVFLVALLVSLGVSIAQADDAELEWKRIIGITQPNAFVGGAVQGGGFAWSVKEGRARVDLEDGDIRFAVRGLVLAGGPQNSVRIPFVIIGTNRGITLVRGTLVCNVTGAGGATLVDTPAVPLSAQGNAKFKGNVSIPSACTTEPNDIAFLIRSAEPSIIFDRWIANGAIRKP